MENKSIDFSVPFCSVSHIDISVRELYVYLYVRIHVYTYVYVCIDVYVYVYGTD